MELGVSEFLRAIFQSLERRYEELIDEESK